MSSKQQFSCNRIMRQLLRLFECHFREQTRRNVQFNNKGLANLERSVLGVPSRGEAQFVQLHSIEQD